MMLRKSCPRCQGDLFLDRSERNSQWNCLQCGRSFVPQAAATPDTAPAIRAA